MDDIEGPHPVIGEDSKLYGYAISVALERDTGGLGGPVPRKMFATFEYNGEQSVYEVPDLLLFEQLASYMLANARMRHEHGEYGYAKVWIKKHDGAWVVDLP